MPQQPTDPAAPETASRVLVIDDDSAIRDVLVQALRDEGYEVQAAADGQAGLDVLSGWPADLIVLDLMMPRLDGWGFRAVQRSESATAAIPVVVLSAVHNLGAATESMLPDASFGKPFDLFQVLDAIEQILRRQRPSQAASS